MVKFYSMVLRKEVMIPASNLTTKLMYVNGAKKYQLIGKYTQKPMHKVYKFVNKEMYNKCKK